MNSAPILIQPDIITLRPVLRDISSLRHLSPQTRIASIIVTAHAAPKIATNNRSPCDNARPQPKAASTASATSSRKRGFHPLQFHLAHILTAPRPPGTRTDGRDLP